MTARELRGLELTFRSYPISRKFFLIPITRERVRLNTDYFGWEACKGELNMNEGPTFVPLGRGRSSFL